MGAFVLLVVVAIAVIVAVRFFVPYSTTETDLKINFYVLGDSQGFQGGIDQVVTIANLHQPDFVFHCGDLTPFGQESQYSVVFSTLGRLNVPFYTTPGNHDIRLGGNLRYIRYFGPSKYSFDIDDAHFMVFNTSLGDISESDMTWIQNDLLNSTAQWKFVFTHIPPFDPRANRDHALLNETTATRLMSLFEDTSVDVVFAGHIHMYNKTIRNGVHYVITGGAGASLVADLTEGGIYHFVNVTVTDSGLSINPIILDAPQIERDIVNVKGNDEDVTLSIEDLLEMQNIEGLSRFQNQFGNWRGNGIYSGVKVSDLLELVGGMTLANMLRITAQDGFEQDFCYGNVYPNSSWYSIQGDMILAFKFNGTSILEWNDGMRIVMLPPDNTYSNADCLATSAPGTGCHEYTSGGARWIRWVKTIEILEW